MFIDPEIVYENEIESLSKFDKKKFCSVSR